MKVRQSFFLDMNLDDKEPEAKEIIRLLYRQFYSGSDSNLCLFFFLQPAFGHGCFNSAYLYKNDLKFQ